MNIPCEHGFLDAEDGASLATSSFSLVAAIVIGGATVDGLLLALLLSMGAAVFVGAAVVVDDGAVDEDACCPRI